MTPSPSHFFRFLTSLALFIFSLSASAAVTVTSTADGVANAANCPGANCRLRDAIAAAVPGDTINFAVTGTITLTSGEIVINKPLTITGPGANVLAISGNNASRIFNVTAVVAVTITGLTITQGNVAGFGGGMRSSGPLTLTDCHFTSNTATGAVSGGGVQLFGADGAFTGCTFSNNISGGSGGGINFQGDGGRTLTLVNCTITGNQANGGGVNRGGGILNQSNNGSSTLQVNNCTIANNTSATANGDGIATTSQNNETATARTFLRSTIIANNTLPNLTAAIFSPAANGSATVTSQGFNLASDNGSGFLNQPTDILNTDPQLGGLANNGGPTPTLALSPTSPALDKGNSFGLISDQRGFARIFDFPAIPNAADGTDIGAFELNAVPLILAGDPALCLDAGGLVGVQAFITNSTGAAAASTLTATLPTGLTAIAGTCLADVAGPCTISPDGSTVSWNGTLANGQTLTLTYRARIAANVAQGTQLTINNTAMIGAQMATFTGVVSVVCPPITNTRVSDQKAGSVLVFPYYTSTIGGASDTRLTISNISNAAPTLANQTYVHLFLIDGTSCQQADFYLCLTPNASFSFKASDYDPGNTGYVIAVAVNAQGVPIQNNVLIGNAFVNTPEFADNYGAESFWANSFAVATVSGNTATLWFDQVGYDALPRQFAVEIQSPLDAPGQQIVTAGLIGDMTIGPLVGAAQVGTGQAFNEQEKFVSFNNWLTGSCQARATISTANPRVPNGLGNLIKAGQAGSMKFNVMGAVGLLMTPRTATWRGIRTLHKTQTVAGVLTIPLFTPVC